MLSLELFSSLLPRCLYGKFHVLSLFQSNGSKFPGTWDLVRQGYAPAALDDAWPVASAQ